MMKINQIIRNIGKLMTTDDGNGATYGYLMCFNFTFYYILNRCFWSFLYDWWWLCVTCSIRLLRWAHVCNSVQTECTNLGLEPFYRTYVQRLQRSYLSVFFVMHTVIGMVHTIVLVATQVFFFIPFKINFMTFKFFFISR